MLGTLDLEVSTLNLDEEDQVRSGVDPAEVRMRMRESLELAEALAQASLMTSSSAKRRLAARRVEMDSTALASNVDYVPPKDLLIYLVRMGSFNSTPKIINEDTQDEKVTYPNKLSRQELLNICLEQRSGGWSKLSRLFQYKTNSSLANINNSKRPNAYDPSRLRVLQWNVLSQTLGQHNDNFVRCPPEALEWSYRRYAIVEEIIQYEPDIVCLQEVDHFNFLKKTLGTQGYVGMFVPKPDSPCMYISNNNGPDGCAIFYKSDKFECVKSSNRILEVWRVQSNQVSIAMTLLIKETGKKICVVTTHLKAKKGALLAKLRNEQGRDLLEFVFSFDHQNPVIICGDFNAEPTEPIYETILTFNKKNLASAYASVSLNNNELLSESSKSAEHEPPYTTWKVREEGEVCHTLDYIFYDSMDIEVESILKCPTDIDIGPNRVPSLHYPSDHFSLVCDINLK